MTTDKTIDLRELQQRVIAHVILFDDGIAHGVRAVNGEAMHLLKNAAPNAQLEASYAVVATLVPSLSEAQVRSLAPDVVASIIEIAFGGLDEVEATDPNGAAPATPNASPA